LAYKVIWHTDAIEDLLNLDKNMQKKIAVKVKDYLAKEPLTLGKPLQGIFKGLHRYRYGDYRIVYSIDRSNENVIILRIGHRKEVYK
jgi:mRNA interferase RelE/StbE